MTAPITAFPIGTSLYTEFDTVAKATAANISATPNFVRTNGYYSAGDGGGATYKRVVSNPNLGTAGFQSADGAFWLINTAYSYSVLQFGAVGDDSTDNLPFFNAALTFLISIVPPPQNTPPFYGPTAQLNIPIGKYFFSGPLNVHVPIHIKGAGAQQVLNAGTILRFSVNQWGVVFHEFRTLDNGGGNAFASAGLGDSSGGILEGVSVWGGNAQSVSGPFGNPASNNLDAHGIWIRTAFVTLLDCSVAFTSGDGIHINATSGSTGATAGQANLFRFYNCNVQFCSGNGFLIGGADANAGLGTACSAISNGGSGCADLSFLGNTWIGFHARDNGIFDPNVGPGNYGAPVGTCFFGGKNYYIVAAPNLVSQATAASTTTPGTDATVWAEFSGETTNSPTWVTGKTWQVTAPYLTNSANVNANTLFLGCYQETSQNPSQITYPTLMVGGSIEPVGVVGSGNLLVGSQSGPSSYNGFKIQGTTAALTNLEQLLGQNGGQEVLYYQLDSSNNYRIGLVNGAPGVGGGGYVILRQDNNAAVTEQWGFENDTSNMGPRHHFIGRLFIGNANLSQGIMLRTVASGPSEINGEKVTVGSRLYYNNPVAGSPEGFVCTTGGTVGSSAAFVPFGYIPGTVGFSSLPSSPVGGQICSINNCSTTTPGAAADGAGANSVMVWYNAAAAAWHVLAG